MQFRHTCTCTHTQAQKSIETSNQKLRLLKISLENRLEEFPQVAEQIRDQEQNGGTGTPTLLPRPNQVSGVLYVKLLGMEGTLDLQTLRTASAADVYVPYSSPRTFSTGNVILSSARNFMTLPTPSHRDREKEREREREKDDDLSSSYTTSSLLRPARKGSKHIKSKATTLQKQHSLDHITDDPSGGKGVGSCKSYRGHAVTFDPIELIMPCH